MLFNANKITIVLLLFIGFTNVCAGLSDTERETKAKELSHLQKQIKSITEDQQQVRDQHDVVQKELRKTERAINRSFNKIKKSNRKLAQQNKKLKALLKQQQKLQATVTRHQGLLAQQIRAAYMTGKQAYIKLLLNQQDPATMGRIMKYYDYLNQARKQQIDRALETLQALETVGEEIRRKKGKIEKIKKKQLTEKKGLQSEKHKRKIIITRLSNSIQSKQQVLDQLKSNEQDLKVLLEAIVDILTAPAQQKPFKSYRGKMSWPVRGRVQNVFGKPRTNSKVKWNGVVINAREGSRVRAVARGRVAYADWLRGYGLLIILDHGDGYMSLYGHNQSLAMEVGDWVEVDQVIASVGMSGGQKKSALYFEIRKNGRPSNPAKWCTRSQGRG
jgi:septal ring factor EnvC (AmiA/AmiB activator)